MAAKKFEVIRPKSIDDANYAEFEYLIRWIGRDGADYTLIFYDAEFRNKINNDVINAENADRIESLIDEEKVNVRLTKSDLSLNDLDVIGGMFANKYVTRIKLDGTIERYAPEANSYRKRLMNNRYNVEFELRAVNETPWK